MFDLDGWSKDGQELLWSGFTISASSESTSFLTSYGQASGGCGLWWLIFILNWPGHGLLLSGPLNIKWKRGGKASKIALKLWKNMEERRGKSSMMTLRTWMWVLFDVRVRP